MLTWKEKSVAEANLQYEIDTATSVPPLILLEVLCSNEQSSAAFLERYILSWTTDLNSGAWNVPEGARTSVAVSVTAAPTLHTDA